MERIGAIVFALLLIWACWRALQRAGYSGLWAILMVVPFVNLIALYVFAYSDWPVLKRGRADVIPPPP